MSRKIRVALVLAAALLSLVLAACGSADEEANGFDDGNNVENPGETVRIGSLKGPTTIGIAAMMDAEVYTLTC